MKIGECNCPPVYQADQTKQTVPSSYQQMTAFSQDNNIAIRTKEGDTVNISQSYTNSFGQSAGVSMVKGGQIQTFTNASLQYENFDFQVVGDLNEEELSDIKHLFKDLFKIAGQFFSGDLDKAYKKIGKLDKHMDSISEVSASFSRSSLISTFSNNYHPISDFQEQLAESFNKLEELKESEDFTDMLLKAQWKQISEILDHHNELLEQESDDNPTLAPLHTQSIAHKDPLDVESDDHHEDKGGVAKSTLLEEKDQPFKHAEKMMRRITDTITSHPRLSPFTVPIAERAIDQAAELMVEQPEKTAKSDWLKEEFIKYFDKWFFG